MKKIIILVLIVSFSIYLCCNTKIFCAINLKKDYILVDSIIKTPILPKIFQDSIFYYGFKGGPLFFLHITDINSISQSERDKLKKSGYGTPEEQIERIKRLTLATRGKYYSTNNYELLFNELKELTNRIVKQDCCSYLIPYHLLRSKNKLQFIPFGQKKFTVEKEIILKRNKLKDYNLIFSNIQIKINENCNYMIFF